MAMNELTGSRCLAGSTSMRQRRPIKSDRQGCTSALHCHDPSVMRRAQGLQYATASFVQTNNSVLMFCIISCVLNFVCSAMHMIDWPHSALHIVHCLTVLALRTRLCVMRDQERARHSAPTAFEPHVHITPRPVVCLSACLRQ